MEKIYQDFKDIADIRLVYINEAHAADSSWPVGYARDLGITDHTSYGERCGVAEKLLDDKSLTIPTVIDGMDNKVNKLYQAWPDRVFLVRTDGRLAVTAKRGPWGYKPAMEAARAWLAEYKETGVEPPLPEDAVPADHGIVSHKAIVGRWKMELDMGGVVAGSDVIFEPVEDGLGGAITLHDQEEPGELSDVRLDGGTLTMRVRTPDGQVFNFKGTLEGTRFEGVWTGGGGVEIKARGRRAEL